MRRLLKLQHHKHTGKLLPHRHTSYRALAVLLVLLGIVVGQVGWGLRQVAKAEDLFVFASVPAPIPLEPAVILHPPDGTVTNVPTITVSGTCPVMTPPIIVVLYSNARLLGSTPCAGDGTFSLQVTLTLGANRLIARVLTVTGDYGPDSAPVTVTYAPTPPPAGTPASLPGRPSAGAQPGQNQGLVIVSRKPFILFTPYKDAEWVGYVSGGQPPYNVTFDWGDGSIVTYKHLDSEERTFRHRYKKMRPYVIKIEATDSGTGQASAVYAAGTLFVPPTSGGLRGYRAGISTATLLALYSGYLSLVCVVGIVWLQARHLGNARLQLVPATTRSNKKRAVKPKRRR